MTTETFREHRFSAQSQALIMVCNLIVEDYLGQGLRLTLRQLYYQLVTRNAIPNSERAYKNLSSLVSDARLAGLVDWEAIEDRIRVPRMPPEFSSLEELVEAALASYRLPRWAGQAFYVELWVEKDALAGVLAPLALEAHVPLLVNRGYSSQSAMYEAANRFQDGLESGPTDRRAVLLYLGDFDPSGEDMVRDIEERLDMFGVTVEVRKVALTPEQIKQYNPPPNPAKMSDPRAAEFVARHGGSSWEVDALPPNVLDRLIRRAFAEVLDRDKMDAVVRQEERDKARLHKALRTLDKGKKR